MMVCGLMVIRWETIPPWLVWVGGFVLAILMVMSLYVMVKYGPNGRIVSRRRRGNKAYLVQHGWENVLNDAEIRKELDTLPWSNWLGWWTPVPLSAHRCKKNAWEVILAVFEDRFGELPVTLLWLRCEGLNMPRFFLEPNNLPAHVMAQHSGPDIPDDLVFSQRNRIMKGKRKARALMTPAVRKILRNNDHIQIESLGTSLVFRSHLGELDGQELALFKRQCYGVAEALFRASLPPIPVELLAEDSGNANVQASAKE